MNVVRLIIYISKMANSTVGKNSNQEKFFRKINTSATLTPK